MIAKQIWAPLLALGISELAGAQSMPQAETPSDPQIAAIVVSSNTVDIKAGKLAKSRTKNTAVKEFAETMIRDHTSLNKQANDLVRKLGVTPEANETSRSLDEGGKKNEMTLRRLRGAAFDKAYVDHEVAFHEQVLDSINSVLIPNARNADLKALLVKAAPIVEEHLDHAKQLQSQLAGTAER